MVVVLAEVSTSAKRGLEASTVVEVVTEEDN